MARRIRDPSIPHPTQENLLAVIGAVKEGLEIGQRLRGREGDSFVRYEEFQAFTGGQTVTNLSAHVEDTDNPHQVTAAQIGAEPEGAAQTVQNNLNAHAADGTIHVEPGSAVGDVVEWTANGKWEATSRLTDLEAIIDIIAEAVGVVFVTHNGETVTHNGEVVYYIEN